MRDGQSNHEVFVASGSIEGALCNHRSRTACERSGQVLQHNPILNVSVFKTHEGRGLAKVSKDRNFGILQNLKRSPSATTVCREGDLLQLANHQPTQKKQMGDDNMAFQNEILGGLLIGLGSALPLIWEGRIAGVSGYAATSLHPKSKEGQSALLFVVGLVVGAFAWRALNTSLPSEVTSNIGVLLGTGSGLLVGFGSRLAGGCTSGHGVCGLGRLSKRSLIAVLVFMCTAILVQSIGGPMQ